MWVYFFVFETSLIDCWIPDVTGAMAANVIRSSPTVVNSELDNDIYYAFPVIILYDALLTGQS